MKQINQNKKNVKALVLFSGGLDSRLVIKILSEQLDKKNIIALIFNLPFGSRYEKSFNESLEFCKQQGIKTKIINVTKGKFLQEYFKILKNPKYGYGSACNPCIDCHIWMLKKAKEYADKQSQKIEIIATGEVLGERPMSQNKKALDIIEQEAGLKGRLLRPLSAKLLPETQAEKFGLIDRNKLFGIQGRSRKLQIGLAKKYDVSFPSPGGGCLLCEPDFCQKLKPLLEKEKIEEIDIALLKIGRHFENSNIVLGKNHQENLRLEEIYNKYKQGILLVPEQPGPTAFVKDKKFIDKAKELIKKYSKHEIINIKEK
ncbi:MAG: 7-cyano-7-deazaguanine synthase [Candidatus Pacearchaeota archaeon]